jgi:hypothetical protein
MRAEESLASRMVGYLRGESLGVRVFTIMLLSWLGENISLVRSH